MSSTAQSATWPTHAKGLLAPSRARRLFLALGVVAFCVCLVPSFVQAAGFTRPFLRRLTVGAAGRLTVWAGEGGGVAVNGEDDLWVGSGSSLDEFSPAYQLTAGEEVNRVIGSVGARCVPPVGLAVDYFAPEPPFVRCGGEEGVGVAVDHSTACTLVECAEYVADVDGHAVERLNASEEEKASDFAFAAACEATHCGYVKGSEITGRPEGLGALGGCGQTFGVGDPVSVAVGALGDVFVGAAYCDSVFEYEASGKYVRAFEVSEAPAVGGRLAGVGYDPVSGHLLVAITSGAIDEFEAQPGNPRTGKFVAQVSEAEGEPLGGLEQLAVDSHGDVYAIEPEDNAVDVWGAGAYYPDVVAGPVGDRDRQAGTAVLHGSVDPAQDANPEKTGTLSECFFEYVEEAEYARALAEKKDEGFLGAGRAACEAPAAGEIASEPEVASVVHGTASGLVAGTTYRYRLVAVSGGPKGGASKGGVLAFTQPAAPRVTPSAAEDVSSSFADLRAGVDPLGVQTTYHFEYDTRPYSGPETHGASVPVPDAAVGAGGATGSSVEGVQQQVGGLSPGTTYYFRVVASNEAGVTYGAQESFTTLPSPSAGAGEARGYELVTPDVKEGSGDMFAEPNQNGLVENREDDGSPASAGAGFYLEGKAAFGSFPFAAGSQAYIFRRGAGAWGFVSLASAALATQSFKGAVFEPVGLSTVALSEELGALVGEGLRLVTLVGPPGAASVCTGEVSLQAAVSEGCYILLHEDAVTHGTPGEGAETVAIGASRDLSVVVLESQSVLGQTSTACKGAEGLKHGAALCEWTGGYETLGNGTVVPALGLVAVKPGSEDTPVSECGATLGNPTVSGGVDGAVSADGTRVFFTAPDPEAERTSQELGKFAGKEGCWNRIGKEGEETGKPPAEEPRNAPQLYVRLKGGSGYRTLEVSEPEAGVREAGSKQAGQRPVQYPAFYVGASEDGSRVFFATRTEMTGEAAALGLHDMELYECEILEGGAGGPECRLWRVSAGEAGQPGSTAGANVNEPVAVAAQGGAVYFGADSVLSKNATATQGIYRYDTVTHTTSFVHAGGGAGSYVQGKYQPNCPKFVGACSISSFETTADGEFFLFPCGEGLCRYAYEPAAAQEGSVTQVTPSGEFVGSSPSAADAEQVQAISENGQYVFFQTTQQLVAQATNQEGEHPTVDTYQWHDGQISLIGSGSSPAPTFFLGYSPYEYTKKENGETVRVEGGNVFIGTHAKLAPQDTNNVGNVYDARICEPEAPCIQPPAAETAQCEGDSCQHPPATPNDPSQTLLPPAPLAPSPVPKPVPETRAQKLAKALRACRKDRGKKKRASCERAARRAYGSVKRSTKARKSGRGRGR